MKADFLPTLFYVSALTVTAFGVTGASAQDLLVAPEEATFCYSGGPVSENIKHGGEYSSGNAGVNFCTLGRIQISSGNWYLGHFNGTVFTGRWYGSRSCSKWCDWEEFGTPCWGNVTLEYDGGRGDGKEYMTGIWDYCGEHEGGSYDFFRTKKE